MALAVTSLERRQASAAVREGSTRSFFCRTQSRAQWLGMEQKCQWYGQSGRSGGSCRAQGESQVLAWPGRNEGAWASKLGQVRSAVGGWFPCESSNKVLRAGKQGQSLPHSELLGVVTY